MTSRYLYATVAAFAGLVTVAHAHEQQPPAQTASIALSDNVYTPGQATIALGGKVSFGYADGNESHNVHFERGGAECTQFTGAAVGAVDGRALPARVEVAGWSGECRFTQPGTYAFFCDDHADMTGTITVANADGTLPVEATPTPTATPTPQPAAQPTPTPAPGGSTPTPTPTSLSLAAAQKGNAVTATLTGGSTRQTVTIEALARRADLKAKGKAKLVRVGKASKTVEPGAKVTLKVPLNAKAKAALKRLRKLKLTVNVTVAGETRARSVTLRVK